MSHPFGDLVSQHLHRKHGLSQSKLAAGILQAPSIITAMCKGRRLTGPQARERVVAIIGWLHGQGALDALDEANALLDVAGMSKLNGWAAAEVKLAQTLRLSPVAPSSRSQVTPKHNLPAPASSLIGREKDVATVRTLLQRDGIRLMSLLGPPGVGKTRLALQVAWDAHSLSPPSAGQAFADGVWFVPLAPVDDPQHVAATIVQTLDVPNVGTPPLVLLKNHLRDKQLLLVLDNFEQLLDATTVVAELLAAAPNVKILTTSRAALQLSSEHLFEVRPLAESLAVELFVQRAQAIKPGFALSDVNAQTIADICQRLDGLPLAIELAAARIRMFDPMQLLARLSSRLDLLTSQAQDLPTRQRTLRGTIEWSYNLLSPEEQTLFRRLGVFAGGCSLEAAERVAGDGLQTSVSDLVLSLADKSLIKFEVQDGETRCLMLETIRKYALERLSTSGESEATGRRHADYFVEYGESNEPKPNSPEQLTWLKRLDRDGDNLWVALEYIRQADDTPSQLRFVAALWPWLRRAHHADTSTWLSGLLTRSYDELPKLIRARATLGSAEFLLSSEGNPPEVRRWVEESASLFRELRETRALARSLAVAGCVAWLQGDYAQGNEYCEQSAELFAQVGDDLALADSLNFQAAIARDLGDFERAAVLFEQSLWRIRQLNDRWNEGNVVNGLGDLEFNRGNCARARVRYEEALVIWQDAGGNSDLPLRGLGRIAYVQGDLVHAEALLSTCIAKAQQWSSVSRLQWSLHHFAFVKHLVGDEAGATTYLNEALALQHRQVHRICIAESLERFAWVAADTQQPHRAARLFGAAEALRKWMGAPLPLGDKPLYDHYLEIARAELDEASFSAAWEEGHAMNLDQVVDYALGEGETQTQYVVDMPLPAQAHGDQSPC